MKELENLFNWNWIDWCPTEYRWSKPLTDSRPYQIIRKPNSKLVNIVFNAVGIDEKDVKLSIERVEREDYLVIEAETKHELTNRNYNVSGRFKLDGDQVDNIQWSLSNGILQVDVMFREPEPSKIQITKK